MPDEGGIHHHQAMVLDTGWGSYISTQLWQHLVITQHRVRTLQDCHTPPPHHFRLQSEVHASDHLSTDWKFQDPTVDLISLLEWLKELRETFYLQDFLFIIKGYKYGTARWKKMHKAKYGKRTMSFHIIFRRYQSSQISRYSHIWKLSKLHPSVILWRLHYSGTIDSTIGRWWLNSMQGWGRWHLKFQHINPVVGFPSNQPPSFAVIQSHLINRKDSFILGNFQGF